jgi:hypothetical protein
MLKLHVAKGMMPVLDGNHWEGAIIKVYMKMYTMPIK